MIKHAHILRLEKRTWCSVTVAAELCANTTAWHDWGCPRWPRIFPLIFFPAIFFRMVLFRMFLFLALLPMIPRIGRRKPPAKNSLNGSTQRGKVGLLDAIGGIGNMAQLFVKSVCNRGEARCGCGQPRAPFHMPPPF